MQLPGPNCAPNNSRTDVVVSQTYPPVKLRNEGEITHEQRVSNRLRLQRRGERPHLDET